MSTGGHQPVKQAEYHASIGSERKVKTAANRDHLGIVLLIFGITLLITSFEVISNVFNHF